VNFAWFALLAALFLVFLLKFTLTYYRKAKTPGLKTWIGALMGGISAILIALLPAFISSFFIKSPAGEGFSYSLSDNLMVTAVWMIGVMLLLGPGILIGILLGRKYSGR